MPGIDELICVDDGSTDGTATLVVANYPEVQVLEQGNVHYYPIELALNQYMLENNRKVRWLPVSSESLYATQKLGIWEGIKKERRMSPRILAYLGFRKVVKQVLVFGRERI